MEKSKEKAIQFLMNDLLAAEFESADDEVPRSYREIASIMQEFTDQETESLTRDKNLLQSKLENVTSLWQECEREKEELELRLSKTRKSRDTFIKAEIILARDKEELLEALRGSQQLLTQTKKHRAANNLTGGDVFLNNQISENEELINKHSKK